MTYDLRASRPPTASRPSLRSPDTKVHVSPITRHQPAGRSFTHRPGRSLHKHGTSEVGLRCKHQRLASEPRLFSGGCLRLGCRGRQQRQRSVAALVAAPVGRAKNNVRALLVGTARLSLYQAECMCLRHIRRIPGRNIRVAVASPTSCQRQGNYPTRGTCNLASQAISPRIHNVHRLSRGRRPIWHFETRVFKHQSVQGNFPSQPVGVQGHGWIRQFTVGFKGNEPGHAIEVGFGQLG